MFGLSGDRYLHASWKPIVCITSAWPGARGGRCCNSCGVEKPGMHRHSHREPAAHVEVVEDLQAARPRLHIPGLQCKGIEGPCGSIRSLQRVRRGKHQSRALRQSLCTRAALGQGQWICMIYRPMMPA